MLEFIKLWSMVCLFIGLLVAAIISFCNIVVTAGWNTPFFISVGVFVVSVSTAIALGMWVDQ